MPWTDEGTALYDAVVAAPGDDTHRLVMADWLDENGYSERAEYVRLGVRRAVLGGLRLLLEKCVLRRHGPGYYSTLVDDVAAKPGDRVDVEEYWSPKFKRGQKPKVRHGLVVVRVEPDGPGAFGGVRAVLKEDDQSVPWPETEVQEIEARMDELFHAHGRTFARARDVVAKSGKWAVVVPPTNPRGASKVDLEFGRGFASRVMCDWREWSDRGDDLCRLEPVTGVRFTGWGPSYTYLPAAPGVEVRTGDETVVEPVHGDETLSSEHAAVRRALSRRWPKIPADRWDWPGMAR